MIVPVIEPVRIEETGFGSDPLLTGRPWGRFEAEDLEATVGDRLHSRYGDVRRLPLCLLDRCAERILGHANLVGDLDQFLVREPVGRVLLDVGGEANQLARLLDGVALLLGTTGHGLILAAGGSFADEKQTAGAAAEARADT